VYLLYYNYIIWGLGIGDWGLGIGDWGLGPIPNPQSPIPNPQSPYLFFKNNYIYIILNLNKIFPIYIFIYIKKLKKNKYKVFIINN